LQKEVCSNQGLKYSFQTIRILFKNTQEEKYNRSAVTHKSEGRQSKALANLQTLSTDAFVVPRSIPETNDRARVALSANASWLRSTSTRRNLTAFPKQTRMSVFIDHPEAIRDRKLVGKGMDIPRHINYILTFI
jgi:hypothetical protein